MYSSTDANGTQKNSDTSDSWMFISGTIALMLVTPVLWLYEIVFLGNTITYTTLLWPKPQDIEIIYAMSFLLIVLFYLQIAHRRISLQWARRYPYEKFQQSTENKYESLLRILITPTCVMFWIYSVRMDISFEAVGLGIIFGLCCQRIFECSLAKKFPQDSISERIATAVFTTAGFFFCLFLSFNSSFFGLAYLMKEPQLFEDLVWIGTFILFSILLIIYLQSLKNLRKINEWRENIKTGHESANFESLEKFVTSPKTPFLFDTGLKFRTLVNKEYSWESQRNPDTILSLIHTHTNKVLLVNIVSVLIIFIYPGFLFLGIFLFELPPPNLRGSMSQELRSKWNDVLRRSEEFFKIESDDGGIRSISAKHSDRVFFTGPNNAFCRPDMNLCTSALTSFEEFSFHLDRLEMIRDKGVMYGPESPMNILANALGFQDRLLRHTQKLQLDHFEKTGIDSKMSFDNSSNVSKLEERLSEQVSILKARLLKHENLLNLITEAEQWQVIYTESRTKSALNDIRTCTEKLLYSRWKIVGRRKLTGRNRTLSPLIDKLSSQNVADLEGAGLKHAKVILSFVNPASHNLSASDDDYLATLSSFVQLVEWHVENPPEKTRTPT